MEGEMPSKRQKAELAKAEQRRSSIGIKDERMDRTLYWDDKKGGWTWAGDVLGPVTKWGNHSQK
jgi:hypothetical protein